MPHRRISRMLEAIKLFLGLPIRLILIPFKIVCLLLNNITTRTREGILSGKKMSMEKNASSDLQYIDRYKRNAIVSHISLGPKVGISFYLVARSKNLVHERPRRDEKLEVIEPVQMYSYILGPDLENIKESFNL
jgi:hypothetical protein